MAIKNLTPIEVLAISKAVNGQLKDARTKIHAGEYPVDFAIEIKGTVKIGEDYLTSKSKTDLLAVIVMLASEVEESTLEHCIDLATRFKISDDTLDWYKNQIDEAFGKTQIKCKGKVETTLFVEG